MDENHQDKTESKLTATEDNTTPSSLSPQDQRGTDQLQDNQMEDTIKHLRGKPGYKVIVEYDKLGHPSKFSQEILPRKTWWDLLNLIGILLIPLVVAGATIGFGWWQVHLADLQHIADQQRALDQQRATILQTYIDNIQDLLLHDDLLKSSLDRENPYYDIAILARARTLTALQGLDPGRKSLLVQFIYQAKLIFFDPSYRTNNPIIALGEADLSYADFSHIFLTDADLEGANLTHANLTYTDLLAANLFGAHLSGADLSRANLDGAELSYADLEGANLTHADLSGADLYGTHLTHANLTHADLSGARRLTQQQLDQVYSCKNAILPPGLTCHNNQ